MEAMIPFFLARRGAESYRRGSKLNLTMRWSPSHDGASTLCRKGAGGAGVLRGRADTRSTRLLNKNDENDELDPVEALAGGATTCSSVGMELVEVMRAEGAVAPQPRKVLALPEQVEGSRACGGTYLTAR